MKKHFLAVIILLCISILALSACAKTAPAPAAPAPAAPAAPAPAAPAAPAPTTTAPSAPKRLVYVTFGTTSTLYKNAAGQGTILSKFANMQVTVSPTSGVFAMVPLLETGEAQLATLHTIHLYIASTGQGGFEKKYPQLRILMAGFKNCYAFHVLASSNIKTIADLKGKRVELGTKGFGPWQAPTVIGSNELLAYGIDPQKDITSMEGESIAGMPSDLELGVKDAICASTETQGLIELHQRKGIRILPFPKDQMGILEKAGFGTMVFNSTLPPDHPVAPGVPCANTLLCVATTKDLDDDTAYTIVKTLIEHQQDLINIDPLFKDWSLDNAVINAAVPYHPGAIKYYQERGVWTQAAEQHQEQLLAQFATIK